jgi:hypothetical protein
MKNLHFGIEIEMTGITRRKAAGLIARYFETGRTGEAQHDCYDTYTAKDTQGRTWKAMSDGSLTTQRKKNGVIIPANNLYSTEIVSPILNYDDIETLQELVRTLRRHGALVNESCGIHIHVGAENFTAATLRNIVNIIASKEDLLYKALNVGSSRQGYCKKTDSHMLTLLNERKPDNMAALEDIWYTQCPYGRHQHYNSSRYHALNLHATFTKGTVEFRLFNGTLHAGEIKSYIQLCLAIAHQALTQKKASPKKVQTDNEKYTFRCWLLRLGLIGEEFKTCRYHLLKNLEGNAAWRHGAAHHAA